MAAVGWHAGQIPLKFNKYGQYASYKYILNYSGLSMETVAQEESAFTENTFIFFWM
jgi:hypothetical protein